MGTVIMIEHLINDTVFLGEQPGATHDFGIINKTGELNPYSQSFASLNYVYKNNRYQIEFGLIS